MPKEDPKRVEVTQEDQTRINEFNKLNARSHEYGAMIAAKKKILEDLEDAGNELMLSDEDNIRYVIGECFVSMEKEQAEERLQKMSDEVTKDVKDLTAKAEEAQASMKELKALLYGKFGSSINLEE